MKRVFYFLSALLLASACGQNIEPVEQYGDIAGVVYDKKVGDPIPVAQVQLSPSGKSSVTGTDGAFSFTNIEPGRYTVNVTKQGYNDGSNTVTVTAGAKSDCNLLMERIPAYVTSDKAELDFGDNQTLNTLSFNIVNSSYETLSWHIEYDKSSTSFVAEVSPESGTTQYGKTAVIVVKIDRNKLNAGVNESTIVVVSDNGDGSSEVKVRTIGQEKKLASLNVKEPTDVKATSVILNAEITDKGVPEYTERGFVISDVARPIKETAIKVIPAAVDAKNDYSVRVGELTLGRNYYVRAYATNNSGTAYSTNQVQFTTIAILPNIETLAASSEDRNTNTVVLKGNISYEGDPVYSERGFVWSTVYQNPTINEKIIVVSGNGPGEFECRASFQNTDQSIYVRAYAINQKGTAYGEPITVFVPEFISLQTMHLCVQRYDANESPLLWENAASMCENSRVGGYNDWRLPTKDELFQLYNSKDTIGGFRTDGNDQSHNHTNYYWSSSVPSNYAYSDISTAHYYISFKDGHSDYGNTFSVGGYYSTYCMARCVRSL